MEYLSLMNNTTFAAYVPVFSPPIQHQRTERRPSDQPWHPPTRQDYIGFGVVLAIVMGAVLFINVMDKGSR